MSSQLLSAALICTFLATSCDGDHTNGSKDFPAGHDSGRKVPAKAHTKSATRETRFEGIGVSYIVREDKSLGESVSRITVLATDSTYTDSLNIGDKDPVQSGMVADLDENQHDELYLVTRSVGSGTYAHVLAFMRDEQNKLVAIAVPEIGASDQSKGGQFEGYMGHDSVYIEQHWLVRKYPVYKPGDAQDKPSGGMREIKYSLVGTSLEAEAQSVTSPGPMIDD